MCGCSLIRGMFISSLGCIKETTSRFVCTLLCDVHTVMGSCNSHFSEHGPIVKQCVALFKHVYRQDSCKVKPMLLHFDYWNPREDAKPERLVLSTVFVRQPSFQSSFLSGSSYPCHASNFPNNCLAGWKWSSSWSSIPFWKVSLTLDRILEERV